MAIKKAAVVKFITAKCLKVIINEKSFPIIWKNIKKPSGTG
jgi:hypothetical protein